MIKTSPSECMGTISNRREALGLMGAFFVFLLGFPAQADPLMQQAVRIIQQTFQIAIMLLSMFTQIVQPATAKESWIPSRLAHRKVVRNVVHKSRASEVTVTRKAITDQNWMVLRVNPNISKFSYVFEGQATDQGKPYANASVLLRVMVGDEVVTKGTTTGADGSYSIAVTIQAPDNSSMDWTMEAFTPEFKKVEISGRKIVTRLSEPEETPIVINTPVEFVVSSAK